MFGRELKKCLTCKRLFKAKSNQSSFCSKECYKDADEVVDA